MLSRSFLWWDSLFCPPIDVVNRTLASSTQDHKGTKDMCFVMPIGNFNSLRSIIWHSDSIRDTVRGNNVGAPCSFWRLLILSPHSFLLWGFYFVFLFRTIVPKVIAKRKQTQQKTFLLRRWEDAYRIVGYSSTTWYLCEFRFESSQQPLIGVHFQFWILGFLQTFLI